MTALHLFFMVLLGLIKIKSRFTLMSVQSYFLMHYIFIAWSVRSTGYNNVAPLNMNSSEDPACDQRKTISTRDIKQKKRFQEEQQAVVRTLEVKKALTISPCITQAGHRTTGVISPRIRTSKSCPSSHFTLQRS